MTRRRIRQALGLGGLTLIVALAPSPQAADEAGKLRQLAESKAQVAKKIADFYADIRLAPQGGRPEREGIPGGDQVEIWMRRFVDSRLEAAARAQDRIAILTEDLDRLKAISARLKELAEASPEFVKLDALKAEFALLDAEYRLTKEKLGR
jgi:hypothetical protein